jgi:hypothetical protein
MKLATPTVNAAIAAIFGIGFVAVPAQVMEPYGITLTPGTALLSRLFGAALVGYALLSWNVRAAAASDALRAVVVSLFVVDMLGVIISLHGVLSGAENALGWSTVAIYGLLAAGFGYFTFAKAP